MSEVYYRVIAETGAAAAVQDFDEADCDQSRWLRGGDGAPLKFDAEEDAARAYSERFQEVANALAMIGETFGDITIPRDSVYLAHKLVGYLHMQANNPGASA